VPQVESLVRDFGWVSGWRCALAYAYALLGRHADAREQLETLTIGELPRDALWLLSTAQLSEVVADLGDRERAEQLYALLAPYADRCIVALGACCLGSVARSLGRLAITLGRYDQAAAHLQGAIAVNTKIRGYVWVAYSRLDYAEALTRRGDDASAAIEDALATARRLGLQGVFARARQLTDASRAT
jgi:tetratricopeptide (TPR) repeat protein